MVGEVGRRLGTRSYPLDPAFEARERRPHLVCRLAGHGDPQAVALRRHRVPVGEDGHGDHHEKRKGLQRRKRRELPLRRQRAIMDGGPEEGVPNRRVGAVEPRGKGADLRGVEPEGTQRGGKVRRLGHAPRGVGHHEWQPERAHLLPELEQRGAFGAGAGAAQAFEDAGVEAAGGPRIGLEVPGDQHPGPQAETGERRHEQHGNHRREPACPALTHAAPADRCRGTEPAAPAPGPTRRPTDNSRGGR